MIHCEIIMKKKNKRAQFQQEDQMLQQSFQKRIYNNIFENHLPKKVIAFDSFLFFSFFER